MTAGPTTTGDASTYNNYIGGQWVASGSGRTYPVTNPARKGDVLGEFQTSTPDDALSAVEAARRALPGWSQTPAPVRAGFLFRALEIMRERADDIARTITLEEGKPICRRSGRSQAGYEHHRIRRWGRLPHVRVHHTVGVA